MAKPGQTTETRFGPALRIVDQQVVDVGLQPFLAAEARLEADRPVVFGQAEARRDRARGADAEAVIRVAGDEVAPRDRMEREQQVLAPVRLPVRGHAVGDRLLVAVERPVLVDEAQFGHPAPGRQLARDELEDAARGGRRVLRVERYHQQALHVLRPHPFERGADRRLAVGHRQLDLRRRRRGERAAARRVPAASPRDSTSSGEPAGVQIFW